MDALSRAVRAREHDTTAATRAMQLATQDMAPSQDERAGGGSTTAAKNPQSRETSGTVAGTSGPSQLDQPLPAVDVPRVTVEGFAKFAATRRRRNVTRGMRSDGI